MVVVKDDTKLSAASYERVSSDEQAKEGFSLEVQGEKNTAHIRLQGWELYDRYIDPGKSAKNLKRPSMQRLLSDIDKGLVQIVVVHKLDRLTRSVGDLHELLLLFDKKEIKLVSITENIDTSTAMGRMFVYMLGIFAQWYRENLSEEVVKGQKKRAENGLRNSSSRPYGYNVLPEDLSLMINEEEAPIVKMMFDQFINGWGKIKIARELTESGVPSMTGGKWSESIVGELLKNPTYIGAVHWKQRNAPEEDRVITHGMHEPIISMEVWETVQNVAQRRTDGWLSQSSYDFPFSTIVKCGECGRSYHGKMTTRKVVKWNKANYRCSGKYRTVRCGASDIYEPVLERVFFDFLSSFSFESAQPEKKIGGKDTEKEVRRLKKLMIESETKRKNYTRAMGNGKLDYDMFEELVDEEVKKSKEWQQEYERLQELTPMKNVRTLKDIAAQINNLKENWDGMERPMRKMYLQRIFDVLVIKKIDGEWKITGYKLA